MDGGLLAGPRDSEKAKKLETTGRISLPALSPLTFSFHFMNIFRLSRDFLTNFTGTTSPRSVFFALFSPTQTEFSPFLPILPAPKWPFHSRKPVVVVSVIYLPGRLYGGEPLETDRPLLLPTRSSLFRRHFEPRPLSPHNKNHAIGRTSESVLSPVLSNGQVPVQRSFRSHISLGFLPSLSYPLLIASSPPAPL